jgi:hypothetical protein
MTGTATQSAAAAPAQATPATTETGAAATQAGAAGSEAAAGSAVAAQPAGQVDAEGARRALTAARDTLSQMTQLPAAGQLTGEARNQVAQLITNFNELITTQVQWRASYAKVAANLDALLGQDTTDAEAAAPAAAASTTAGATPGAAGTSGSVTPNPEAGAAGASMSGTAGAVGTSGTTKIQVDPTIKAKLMELRKNLSDFEKASGGAEK